jgi:hypothetical protein
MVVKKKPTPRRQVDVGDEMSTIKRYEGFLKVTAGIVGSLGVLYTALWQQVWRQLPMQRQWKLLRIGFYLTRLR